jgi:hypothetical protein
MYYIRTMKMINLHTQPQQLRPQSDVWGYCV